MSEEIKLLKMELEAKLQEVYELKNKISVADSLEPEYSSEIEVITSLNTQREATLIKEIKLAKQALVDLDDKLEDLNNYDTSIKDLMCQKSELEIQKTEFHYRQRKREAALELESQVEESLKYIPTLIRIQEEIDTLSDELASLQSKEIELVDLIEENKEILSSTNAEISEDSCKLSLLQDKYSSLKMAAESVDVELPKLPTQGNSLFAEVHDSEIKLRASLSQLEKYHRKQDLKHAAVVKELEDVSTDLVNLGARLDGIQELDIDNETIKQLKSELEKVTADGKKYKNQISEKFQLFGDSNPDSVTLYFTAVILEKWSEIATIIATIIDFLLAGLNETVTLTKAKQEERKMQRKLVMNQIKVVQLKENYRKANLEKPDVVTK